jgi:signal transduction histidine kinase
MRREDTHRQPSARIDDGDEPARSDLGHRSAELSARALQRLSVLGEMTGGIAHDFRNILSIIDSGLRLAEVNAGDADSVRDFMSGARDSVARGLSLTQQLLSFAQQGEIRICAADVNALLKGLELFLRYGAGPSVSIVPSYSPAIPKCLVDPSQFTAAILNLVINARDAMPGGGEIRINTTLVDADATMCGAGRHGVYVRVRVQDSGLGMPDNVVQRIFEPFFTTKGEKGTGLGIPQVRAFIRQIGGYIEVASHQGRGTTFDLFIPAVEPDYP